MQACSRYHSHMSIIIRPIDYRSEDYTAMLRLRHAVLRAPLGLEFTPEQLAQDATDHHFIAVHGAVLAGGVIVALLADGSAKIRQMVVAPSHQKHGLGTQLLQQAHDFVRRMDRRNIVLHARATAIPFYEKHGYRITGAPFIEVTLPHRRMEIILP